MSNYNTLQNSIRSAVKTNGNNEITGNLLQQILLAMVTSLGAQFQFAGIATPSTNPGSPDYNVAYIGGPGTYTNMGNVTIPSGNLGVLMYNGSWSVQTIAVGGGSLPIASETTLGGIKVGAGLSIDASGVLSATGGGGGGGVNFTTEQMDLTLVAPSQEGQPYMLKFADRHYNAATTNGMGYVILRQEADFDEQVTLSNTIYEIRYDFDLNGETVNVPANCTLKFNGGRILNGNIVFNNTDICAGNKQIFNSVQLSGTLTGKYNILWGGVSSNENATPIFQAAINLVAGNNAYLYIPNGTYLLAPQTVADYSSTAKCHLFVPDSINIVGETKDGCILKRVKADLSAPLQSEYANHTSLWGSLIACKMLANDNGSLVIQNITLDGNENWAHTEFEDSVNGDKLFESIGSNHVVNFSFVDIIAKNQANEGFFATTYDKVGTKVRFSNCVFSNIGGGASNVGGDDFESFNCSYIGCMAEHSWSGLAGEGKAIFKDCVFSDRKSAFLSSDYQGTISDAIKIGKNLFVENCKFFITKSFYDTYISGTNNVNVGILFGVCENAIIKGNTFIGLNSIDSHGGCCIGLQIGNKKPIRAIIDGNNALELRGDGTFISDAGENSFVKNNIVSSKSERMVSYQYHPIYREFKNNSFNYYLDVSAGVASNVQFWLPVWKLMLFRCTITNNSGSEANVTVTMKNRNQSDLGNKTLTIPTSTTKTLDFVCMLNESSIFVAGSVAIRNIGITSNKNVSAIISAYDSEEIPTDAVFDDYTSLVIGSGWTSDRPALTSYGGPIFYDKNLNQLIIWNGNGWVGPDGLSTNKSGATTNRPAGTGVKIGFCYFDTDINKPIWWNGSIWVDVTGQQV